MMSISLGGSFEQVHIIDEERLVNDPLKFAEKLQRVNLPVPDLPMLLQYLNPIFLLLHLSHQIRVILYEEIEQRSHSDVVIGAGVAVTVDAEVEVYGDHRVVDDPAELGGCTRRT